MTLPAHASIRIRPEAELLLLYTRSRIDPPTKERIASLLAAGVDYDHLFELSFRHKLSPFLYARIGEGGEDAFPDLFMRRLRENAEAISRNNLLLTGELVKILKLFSAHGVPVMPFKGPPLAQRLYGSLALRPFGDIDLLVPRSSVVQARELLESVGYEARPALTPALETAHLRFEHDRAFEDPRSGAHLELHWRFFSRYVAFPLDRDDLWKDLRVEKFMGIEILALPPEDLLLFLAAHGSKHHWYSLGWILDIVRLIESVEDLDWDRARDRARATGLERMLRLALRLAGDLWDVPIPEPLRTETSADTMVARLADHVKRLIFERESGLVSQREEHRFYLASRERLRDRAWYVFLWLATPNGRDRAMLPLPSSLSPLYYLSRPLRMLRDLALRIARVRPA